MRENYYPKTSILNSKTLIDTRSRYNNNSAKKSFNPGSTLPSYYQSSTKKKPKKKS